MKAIYKLSLVGLLFLMGCQASDRKTEPEIKPVDGIEEPKPEVVADTVATPVVDEVTNDVGNVVQPEPMLKFGIVPFQQNQELNLNRNEALNPGNNPLKAGCAELSRMKYDLKKSQDLALAVPAPDIEDGVDNPDAQEQAATMANQLEKEIEEKSAALKAKAGSKLVTAKFTVSKEASMLASSFIEYKKIHGDLTSLMAQKSEVMAGAAEDFSYEGMVDELAAQIGPMSEELYSRLTSYDMADGSMMTKADFLKNFDEVRKNAPDFQFVMTPAVAKISLVVNKEKIAEQVNLFAEGETLQAKVTRGGLLDPSNTMDVTLDITYDLACKLGDAKKAYKKAKQEELKPSLMLTVQ